MQSKHLDRVRLFLIYSIFLASGYSYPTSTRVAVNKQTQVNIPRSNSIQICFELLKKCQV